MTDVPELRVAAIIFDMDGVVIDSGDLYKRQWQRWAADHGLDYADIAPVHPGRPPRETIRIVAPTLDAEAEAARYNAALATNTDVTAVSAMPGAVELLPGLPPGRWAIATSAVRGMATMWLRHLRLPVPEALVTVEDVARGKPAPDPYVRAAELLGWAPGTCLVVEDAPAGITAARAAGATVLAVLTTHAARDLTEAHYLTRGLDDIAVEANADGLSVSWRPAPR